jgi:AraC family transcriptional activator of pobA
MSKDFSFSHPELLLLFTQSLFFLSSLIITKDPICRTIWTILLFMKKEPFPIFDMNDFKYLGKENGFYADRFSNQIQLYRERIMPPHRHNFYLSILCTKGSGTHQIEFKNYDVHPGMVFMMVPGQVHSWPSLNNVEGYVFFHTAEFFNLNFTLEKIENYPFFTCLRNSPQIILKETVCKKVEQFYKEILTEFEQDNLMKFQRIASLVNALYISLSREYIPEKIYDSQNLNYLARLRELETLVDKHFKTIKSPNAYAKMMHISLKHLNRICKVCINQTVSEVITDRIILEAKRVIVFSKNNISEIVDELGYEDKSYFSRLFKKKTGKTPLEYMHTIYG